MIFPVLGVELFIQTFGMVLLVYFNPGPVKDCSCGRPEGPETCTFTEGGMCPPRVGQEDPPGVTKN